MISIMKKGIKRFSLLIVVLSLSSCAAFFGYETPQYNKVYPPRSYSLLKGGYWGKWGKFDSYSVKTRYSPQSLEILIYHDYKHPSDYTAKIIIDKSTGKVHNKDWFSYQGTISSKRIPVSIYGYGSNIEWKFDSDSYKTLKCEIRCDKDMQKAIRKNGLYGIINIFYGDGLGDAFSFY